MTAVTEILRTMEYGPAPEANDQVVAWLERHEGRFLHFIGGKFVAPAEGSYFAVINPARGNRLAECAEGTAKDVDKAVAAALKAQKCWAALSGDARARYLYAIARIINKRERFFSVLESMDNGKPIRESRDIDIPLVIRHFYHHAGWAELIESEFPGHEPVGVCGQIIPWNFPLLMLAWKIAPALAAGNTVVLKPAEYHAAHRARLRRGLHGGGPARRRRQHRHRRRRDRCADRRAQGHRQDRLHRLDRGRPHHPEGDGRHGQEALARARRQVALHRLRRRRPRQRGRRRRRRHLVQPGPGLLRRLAPDRAGGGGGEDAREAPRQDGDASRRRSARQVDRHRRDRRRRAARPHPQARGSRGAPRARPATSRKARCRTRGSSIRRRSSPASGPRRSWRRRRFLGRCSSP